jgi:hypothetical protein
MDLLYVSQLFEQFLAQRRYLKNVTSSTIEWYETAFKALQRTHGVDPAMSKSTLQSFVVSLRKRNVKPISCNTYIKALNASMPSAVGCTKKGISRNASNYQC